MMMAGAPEILPKGYVLQTVLDISGILGQGVL